MATVWLVGTAVALAHAGYERVTGSFIRPDRVTISVIESYRDGILGADPVSVEFRGPGGVVIAATDYSRDDLAVRFTKQGVQLYWFPSYWIPVASRVQLFDGFSLGEITGSSQRAISPLWNIRTKWRGYVVMLGLAAAIGAAWVAVRAIPNRGRMAVIRTAGLVVVVLSCLAYALLVCLAPLSPFIFGVAGAIAFAALRRPFRTLGFRTAVAGTRSSEQP